MKRLISVFLLLTALFGATIAAAADWSTKQFAVEKSPDRKCVIILSSDGTWKASSDVGHLLSGKSGKWASAVTTVVLYRAETNALELTINVEKLIKDIQPPDDGTADLPDDTDILQWRCVGKS